MKAGAQADHQVRFKSFELNLESGELWQHGVKIRLYGQPIEVLQLLIEHPGEVVTRDTLQKALWPDDIFVDFEHSLNSTINRLRCALGDSADAPRLIETVPRVGYRFLVPVERIESITDPSTSFVRAPIEPSDGQAAGIVVDKSGPKLTRRATYSWLFRFVAGVSLTALLSIPAGIFFNIGGVRSRLQAGFQRAKQETPLKIKSIAVLPLENLSGDPEQEYFSDGLTDTLITDLGRIVTMRVISRASVMRYKRGKTPMPQIKRELNVDAAVEGTVLRSGNRIRISVQLVDARSDRHLWEDTYERDFVDVIQLERLLAVAIAHEISGRLSPAQEMQLDASQPMNPQAYDAYLQGRHLLGERTEEGETSAREYFEEALRADPNFALAYSGLADTYSVGWFLKVDLKRAEQYARKAIALGPGLAEGHASLGIAETYGLQFPEAGEELKRATVLNPNYAMAHHWYSLHQVFLGHLSEALAENGRARQLDPYSLPINFLRGLILFHSREFDQAVEQFKFASSINPLAPAPHEQIARIQWLRDRVSDALSEQRIVADLTHDPRILHDTEIVARVYARDGTRAALMKQAELTEAGYAQEKSRGRQPGLTYSANQVAIFYGLLGDRRKTLEWLSRYLEDVPVNDLPLDRTAPAFEFLQSDAEYQGLLRRAGLQP